MNREIKFRAWVCRTYDDSNEPIDFHMVQWNQNFFADTSEVTHWSDEFPDGKDCILMQYTGLKDKNGREIYEGDVLEASGEVVMRDQAVFRDGCFMWGDTGEDVLLKYWAPRSIVLGNIYENPELCAAPTRSTS